MSNIAKFFGLSFKEVTEDKEIKEGVKFKEFTLELNNTIQPMIKQTTPIIGWRIWIFDIESERLASYFKKETIWTPGKPLKSHEIVKFNTKTNHGIHAFKDLPNLYKYLKFGDKILIAGTVNLWGTVIEHEHGYRAQYAYPDKLEFLYFINGYNYTQKGVENLLRSTYGCEVADFEFTGEKTYNDGTTIKFENGNYHCDDGPAIVYKDGSKFWWQHGERHRIGGPSVEYASGTKHWHENNLLHRIDGPASEYYDGTKEYYIEGTKMMDKRTLIKEINASINIKFAECFDIKDEFIIFRTGEALQGLWTNEEKQKLKKIVETRFKIVEGPYRQELQKVKHVRVIE